MDASIIALAGQIAVAEQVSQDAAAEQRPALHYIVQSAAAKMPNTCKGKYKRVAVLLVDGDRDSVAMISERARGCHEVVRTWEKLNVGRTERCAYRRALADARALADKLNSGEG